MPDKLNSIVNFIRSIFEIDGLIPLSKPIISAKEKAYVLDALENGNVASQGKYIPLFEERLCELTKAKHAIVVSSGTSALHIALKVAGVENGDEILVQSLSFVATANAISYCGAVPHFVDVDSDTLGMSPKLLKLYLIENTKLINGNCFNKKTNNRIGACVPIHTFGNPMRIKELVAVCNEFGIVVIEDAAQALGSFYKNQHMGTFGELGTFSFNGNKIITSGGGGAVITDDDNLAKKIRYLINQAKTEHPWEYLHSEIGYNYKMPNLNAALGVAQLEQLQNIISAKKELYEQYRNYFKNTKTIQLISENDESSWNYWMQSILFGDPYERDNFLKFTNENNIQTRAVWKPLHQLKMYEDCPKDSMKNTEYIAKRMVNLPSSGFVCTNK